MHTHLVKSESQFSRPPCRCQGSNSGLSLGSKHLAHKSSHLTLFWDFTNFRSGFCWTQRLTLAIPALRKLRSEDNTVAEGGQGYSMNPVSETEQSKTGLSRCPLLAGDLLAFRPKTHGKAEA